MHGVDLPVGSSVLPREPVAYCFPLGSSRTVLGNYYLSHCYTIAWDRLSNQFFLSVYVCMYVCVCVCVSVGTFTVAFFNRSSRNLVRTFGV